MLLRRSTLTAQELEELFLAVESAFGYVKRATLAYDELETMVETLTRKAFRVTALQQMLHLVPSLYRLEYRPGERDARLIVTSDVYLAPSCDPLPVLPL